MDSGITAIGDYAFSNMDSLTTVRVASTVTALGEGAFYNCGNLSNLQIPENVEIEAFAIGGDYGSTRWTYDPSEAKLTVTGSGAMGEPYVEGSTTERNSSYVPWYPYRDQIEEVEVEEGVTNLSTYAFHGMSSLTAVTLPSTLTEIGEGAFESCTSLTYISIPDSVSVISHYAFLGCEGLRSIHIPASVTYIDVKAFSDCPYLHEFYFYGDAPEFGNQAIMDSEYITVYYSGSGWDDVKLFDSLNFESWTPGDYDNSGTNVSGESIKVQTSGKYGEDVEWSFDEDTGVLVIDGTGEMQEPVTIVVQDEETGAVTTNYSSNAVPWRSFYHQIKTVEISDGITHISRYAFYWLTQVESITIPDSMVEIGQQSFVHCSKLQSFESGDQLVTIGERAFEDCTALAAIYLPESLTSIEEGAFSGCEALSDIYYGGNENEWEAIVIGEDNDPLYNATIHYDCTGIDQYEKNPEFEHISYYCKLDETISITAVYITENDITENDITWSCSDESAVSFSGTSIQGPSVTGEEDTYWISVQVTGLAKGDHDIVLSVFEDSATVGLYVIVPGIEGFTDESYFCRSGEAVTISAVYVSNIAPEQITWTCDDTDAVSFGETDIQGPSVTGEANTYHISVQATGLVWGEYEISLNIDGFVSETTLTVGHVDSLSPKCGYQLVGFSYPLMCTIEFDTEIELVENESAYAYLVTYDEGEIIEEISLNYSASVSAIDNSMLTLSFNLEKEYVLNAGTEYAVLIDADAIRFPDDDSYFERLLA